MTSDDLAARLERLRTNYGCLGIRDTAMPRLGRPSGFARDAAAVLSAAIDGTLVPAERVEQLEAENARLRKALEPFAALANAADAWSEATGRPASGAVGHVAYNTAADARDALANTRSRGDG